MKLLFPNSKKSIVGRKLLHARVDELSFEILDYHQFADPSHKVTAKLEAGAKLTDLIVPGNVSAQGFLSSKKLEGLLTNFELGTHRIYQSQVVDYDGNSTEYSYMQFTSSYAILEQLDYQACVFEIFDMYEGHVVKHGVTCSSTQEYNNYRFKRKANPLHNIRPVKIGLALEQAYDIFTNPFSPGTSFFISERLADELAENALTGIVIEESPYELV